MIAPKYTSFSCVWYSGCCMQDNQTDLLDDLESHWCNTFYYFWVIDTTRNTIESSDYCHTSVSLSLIAVKLCVNISVFAKYSFWSMHCRSWSIHEHTQNNCNREAEELLHFSDSHHNFSLDLVSNSHHPCSHLSCVWT